MIINCKYCGKQIVYIGPSSIYHDYKPICHECFTTYTKPAIERTPMRKFTFKKVVHTGMFRFFEKEQTLIKLNKKECGTINEIKSNCYKIDFFIKKEKTKKSLAPFKRIFLKKKFSSEKEAREWVKKNNDKIQNNLDLFLF